MGLSTWFLFASDNSATAAILYLSDIASIAFFQRGALALRTFLNWECAILIGLGSIWGVLSGLGAPLRALRLRAL